LHSEFDFSYPSQKCLKSQPNLYSEVPVEEFHCEGVEGLDVLFEVVAGEVCVAFHYIDDDRAPGDDVTVLGFFVEVNVAVDDVCAKSKRKSVYSGSFRKKSLTVSKQPQSPPDSFFALPLRQSTSELVY
jgi:hypothetical protein